MLEILKNTNYQKIALMIIIFILSVLLFKNCGRTPQDNDTTKLEQNLAYYKDSLKIVKNKANEIEYQRAVLATTNKKLAEENASLAYEVSKEKGKVIFLTKTNVGLSLKIDSLTNKLKPGSINVQVNKDGTQTLTFKNDNIYSDDNARFFEAKALIVFRNDTAISQKLITQKGDTINIGTPVIDQDKVVFSVPVDSLKISFVTGLQEDKDTKLLKIFVRSDFPGFKVNKLDGAIIDPQKSELIKSYFPRKRFGVGFQLGYGISTSGLTPYVGVGISYNIFNF